MTLRKVPGALAFGLLASLIAHAALFGGEHAMGGACHVLLVQTALVAGLGLLVFLGALAWGESGGTAEGSVVAARLRDRLPTTSSILAAAAFWYAAAEAIEPHHAGVPPIAAVIALAVAAWLALRLANAVTSALAGVVIAILRVSFAPRTPSWQLRPRRQPLPRRPLWARRRFARPPPIAVQG